MRQGAAIGLREPAHAMGVVITGANGAEGCQAQDILKAMVVLVSRPKRLFVMPLPRVRRGLPGQIDRKILRHAHVARKLFVLNIPPIFRYVQSGFSVRHLLQNRIRNLAFGPPCSRVATPRVDGSWPIRSVLRAPPQGRGRSGQHEKTSWTRDALCVPGCPARHNRGQGGLGVRVHGPRVTVVQQRRSATASEPIQAPDGQRQPLRVRRCRRTTRARGPSMGVILEPRERLDKS